MKHTWLVRPFPNMIDKLNEFRAKNVIAIGWPGIGDLTGKSREDLKRLLAQPPYCLSGLELGNAYATIDIFVNQMNIGDIVLVPYGEDIYFCKITSDYHHDVSVDNKEDGYPHQRSVQWLSTTSRKMLTKELRSSLKVHRTTADLSHHSDSIEALAEGKEILKTASQVKLIDVTYPLRCDFAVEFKIPSDITKQEAERLSVYLRTLYFVE